MAVLSLATNPTVHIFAGTARIGIFRSTDEGASWEQLTAHYYNSVYALAVNSHGDMFAGSIRGVSRSTDNGTSWKQLPLDGMAHCLAITPRGDIFVGTSRTSAYPLPRSIGILRSTDNGETWLQTQPANDLSFYSTNSLAVDSVGYVYAGTTEAGVLRITEPITSVQHMSAELPNAFSLLQNFPNPFNQSTTIVFSLRRPARVHIDVHDTNGRLVRTLMAGYTQDGAHKVMWDGTNDSGNPVASGIYLCRLQVSMALPGTPAKMQGLTRKLLLLK